MIHYITLWSVFSTCFQQKAKQRYLLANPEVSISLGPLTYRQSSETTFMNLEEQMQSLEVKW